MSQELKFQLSLSLIPGVGGVIAKKLIGYCGGVEAVFKEKKSSLLKIPGIGEVLAKAVLNHNGFARAEKEMAFLEKNNLTTLFFLDKDYPTRLKHCDDGPIMLFVKGKALFNAEKVVGVVGTRSITDYGKAKCSEIVEGLVRHKALVVSGLAYGVDACAHKKALETGLETVAVLGHGLDRIYPPLHQHLAKKIAGQGALVTEFFTGTKPDRENFPKRNRIIAGLCDAIIVVEAASSGGALITANIANSYNRDVFALPGRSTDTFSRGCNWLIKTNKANLLEDIKDLEYIMGWICIRDNQKLIQPALFPELNPEEEELVNFLRQNPEASFDLLVAKTSFTVSKISALLLGLEFRGVIQPLPGKTFRLLIT
ncbi:MAG TPA: DNA-processing protein DprA [Bacteroidales bacterium]|nr:DNA-processing protein DprA [Bacteroidales bacterium]